MKMHIENHIRHIMLYHFDLNELFGQGTISKSQVERWHTLHCLLTPFGILLGETPGETQTFLKRSHDSSSVLLLQERSLLISLQQIVENSDTLGFVVVGEFVGDPYSQFPYFSEIFETTNDGRMVHIEVLGQHSGY